MRHLPSRAAQAAYLSVAALTWPTAAAASTDTTPSYLAPRGSGAAETTPAGALETAVFATYKYVATGDVDTRRRRDLYDDKSTATAGAEASLALSEWATISGDAYIKAKNDHKDDSKDGWGGVLDFKLSGSDKLRLSPYFSYEYAVSYTGFFEAYDYKSHTMQLGLAVALPELAGRKFVVTPTLARVLADKASVEESVYGAKIVGKDIQVLKRKVTVEGLWQWHRYDAPADGMVRRLRERRREAYVGMKLKEFVPGVTFGQLGNLELGVRYVEQASNNPDPKKSFDRVQFLPSLKVKHTFP